MEPIQTSGVDNPCPVGDINSDAKGSGARYNSGKAPLHLIPVQQFIQVYQGALCTGSKFRYLGTLLHDVSQFQLGDLPGSKVLRRVGPDALEQASRVLEYGAQKYAEWNWAKGMPWSVCFGCLLRHAEKILLGEEIDEESGQTHMGHLVANMIFLAYYADHYKEGDDRPPRYDD